jgi:hypothetical protein
MKLRTITLIIATLDTAVFALIAAATFLSGSDAATKGLDIVAGLAVTALFVVTGLPALILAWRGRWPRLALGLSLVFPGVFAAAFVAVVASLA